ncbi:MAG TPA: diacylglycerol kinase [Steroidobacteraceae bacterium]|nr:diacylglycerol kinase [Steroidobacteraceae bacterium]
MNDRVKPTGIIRILRAFGYSLQGFRHTWREEAAFRQEVLLSLLVVPAGIYLGRTGVERALLVSPMLGVLVVELLNSAVEAVVDRSGPERNRFAGMAKDMGSAAVMLSFILLGTVWLLILSDHWRATNPR